MVGGQQFYERKEIKDVIAYLKIAMNPVDEISLRRIINYPTRGIGAATVERAAAAGPTMWEALLRIDDVPGVNAPSREAVHGFVALIEKIRGLIHSGLSSAATQTLVDDVNLFTDLRDASTSASQATRRIDHVRDLIRSITERDAGGADGLATYLHHLSLRPQDDDDAEDDGDVVTLTTLHGAKGLEWPVVFLVGVEEELLPHARTLYPQGPDVDGEVDVSEERRLAYVGITRARERLYMTRALSRHKHGREVGRSASRFLLEIPKDLLQVRDLLAEARTPVEKTELKGFFSSLLK